MYVCVCVRSRRYVKVEEGDPKQGAMFQQLMSEFLSELSSDSTSDERRSWHSALMLESKLMDDLRELNLLLHEHKRVERKIEKLRLLLSDSGSRRDLRHFPEVTRMAVRPDVLLTGMVGDDCTLFRSALAPMLLTFSTAANDKYRVLFKHGDDLRQDQLMIQMINLMDSLLKNVRLDLQLTPYRVLATSSVDGFVEFVPNCTLRTALSYTTCTCIHPSTSPACSRPPLTPCCFVCFAALLLCCCCKVTRWLRC